MRLRLTKVDEFQFLTCVKYGVWGSHSARFSDWQIGDLLAIIVDKQIAGLAEVNGAPYKSDKVVWDNGLFPFRIPIKFDFLFDKQHRPHLLGNIRDALISAWTTRYGWGILNQYLLDEIHAKIVVDEITNREEQNKFILQNIDSLLAEAKQSRLDKQIKEKVKIRKRGRPKKFEVTQEIKVQKEIPFDSEPLSKQEESLHSKAQYILSKIGKITGCSNFIASNDRKRKFNNIELNSLSIPTLPNLGLNKDATDRISRIDVIWLKQNAAICAFEVETSTSIFSGLLRMSDLLSVIPNLNIKLYIVAQKERENKVLTELSRPTFRKIGLNDYCEFISIEDLENLLGKIETFAGHVQPSILDNIAIGFEDENLDEKE
jgi:hypothetical protein